jgi:hypothetical protein
LTQDVEQSRVPAEAKPVSTIRHRIVLTAVIALAVGVPFFLALATGNLSIPHNDGWSYSKIAQVFAETGHIHLLNWNRTALIGQLVMLGPLARWIWVQQFAVSVLAAVGLLLTYQVLARRLTPTRAVFGTALVAVFPGFGLLATSFMEDIPAFVAAVGCIAVADLAFERQSKVLLATALAIGFAGATIREEDLAAPAAVVVAALFVWGRRNARSLVSMAVVFAVALATFEIWRGTLPYGDRSALALTLHAGAVRSAREYLTLALLLSPVVLLSGVFRRPSRLGAALSVPAAAALLGITSVVFLRGSIFLGDYLTSSGAYAGAFIGNRVVIVIPGPVMDLLTALALLSGSLLPAVVVTRWRDLDPMLRGVAILTLLGTIGECFLHQLVFDRDLILLLVPGAVLCLRTPVRGSKRWLGTVPFAGLAMVSLLLCANALARDAAVWGAANQLVSQGVPATRIDAGLDWVGYHATTPGRGETEGRDFWEWMFPRSHLCYVVTLDPMRHRTPIARASYRTYAVLGSSQLDVYQVGSCASQSTP